FFLLFPFAFGCYRAPPSDEPSFALAPFLRVAVGRAAQRRCPLLAPPRRGKPRGDSDLKTLRAAARLHNLTQRARTARRGDDVNNNKDCSAVSIQRSEETADSGEEESCSRRMRSPRRARSECQRRPLQQPAAALLSEECCGGAALFFP
ncbi:unnamed protein product, partial [Ixodes persulcatus]